MHEQMALDSLALKKMEWSANKSSLFEPASRRQLVSLDDLRRARTFFSETIHSLDFLVLLYQDKRTKDYL